MDAKIIIGDIFDTDCDVICHQVNCLGCMKSGIAKEIREKFPKAYENYMEAYHLLGSNTLGGCGMVGLTEPVGTVKYIANLYGQYAYIGAMSEDDLMSLPVWNLPDFIGINDGKELRYTNYEAFYRGIEKLRYDMMHLNLNSVAFPYNIGCDRGGGDWNIILTMINSVFSATHIEVKIYRLPSTKA